MVRTICVVDVHISNLCTYIFINLFFISCTDQLSIEATSDNRVIGEGGIAELTVTASGVNSRNFVYKWKRRGSQFSDRVHGISTATLTIGNVIKSDEGSYYCNVTNEWGNSRTKDITLTVKGTCVFLPWYMCRSKHSVMRYIMHSWQLRTWTKETP